MKINPRSYISRLIRVVFQSLISVFIRLSPSSRFLDLYFEVLRNKLNTFPTYRLRSIESPRKKIPFASSEYLTKKNDIGMVIQGPISNRKKFTYFTILRYLTDYPGLQIVLSTWEGEELDIFESLAIENRNLHILRNIKPKNPGTQNINYQIASTLAGLKAIEKMGLKFAIKTRTDQCFFDQFALDKMRGMYQSWNRISQTKRILFLSQNSFILRLYGPSDMFQFGETEQLLKYWDVPLENRKQQWDISKYPNITIRNYSKEEICEVYLCANYLRKLGIILDYTFNQNLEVFRDYFIIIDAVYIDMCWDKYSFNSDRWGQSNQSIKFHEWSHGYWLSISNNQIVSLDLDLALDLPLMEL